MMSELDTETTAISAWANVVPAEEGEDVAGVFEGDSAAGADGHRDSCYLVAEHDPGEVMLGAALEVDEASLGIRLDRKPIRLGNTASCMGFLAFRDGTPPEARSCGRTLAEDLGCRRWAPGRQGAA